MLTILANYNTVIALKNTTVGTFLDSSGDVMMKSVQVQVQKGNKANIYIFTVIQ